MSAAESKSLDNTLALKLFFHRICFITARAIAILCIPILWLWAGGKIHDNPLNPLSYSYMIIGFTLAILPIVIMKFILRVSCPYCSEGKLDREVVGAGNYECTSCEYASS